MQMLRFSTNEIELKSKNNAPILKLENEIEWVPKLGTMQPYKPVKDVRTGHETSNVDGVMDGQIDDF
jgi:peptide chain release factor 2